MEKVLDGLECLGPALGDVAPGLGLELLPPFLPEPGLVSVDRLLGDEDDGVIDDFRQDDAPFFDAELFPHR
jgi:hypothetical protein